MEIIVKDDSINPNNQKSIENIIEEFKDYEILKIHVGEVYLIKSTSRPNKSTTEFKRKKETKEEELDREADEMRKRGVDEEAITYCWNWMASR